MPTARVIIRDALTFRLNKLSPGEAEDADLFNRCLDGLNNIADEWNGSKAFLFREVLTSGTVTGITGTIGTTWADLSPGDEILGATWLDASQDVPLWSLTMQQYHEGVAQKTQAGDPQFYAHDGLATVYFYPVPTSASVKIRTRQAVTAFADLDTDYSMPAGYRSGLSAVLAELMAPTLLGGIPSDVGKAAMAARNRIAGQALNPAILNTSANTRRSILVDR